jgi:hypothetical protein
LNKIKVSAATTSATTTSGSGISLQDTIDIVISRGTPKIYGDELGVSFEEPVKSLAILRELDPDYGSNAIKLDNKQLKRYTNIGLKISCEFCCGAKSVVFSNGKAACGCAHSWAIRGLIAYLVTNHGDEYTDDQILREAARWKALFFPKQMIQKVTVEIQQGQFTPDVAALLLDVDTNKIGTATNVPIPSNLQNLPNMVGGC